MRRLFLIFIFIILISQITYSQGYRYQKGVTKLSIGIAIPAYDFGLGNGINLSSNVKVGTNIAAEASYFYNWHYGVGFMLNYNVNPIDESRLADAYMELSPAFTSVSANAESFRDIAGLGGFLFDLPVNDYFSLTFKMMGGLRNLYKPTAHIKTTTAFSTVNYYETHNNQMVVAFLFSGGAKMIINENFNVHFNASYMGSNFDFEYKRNSKVIKQSAHVGVLNFTVAVSYSF